MTIRNLMIATMILFVLAAAVTATVSVAKRPTVTVKIPYQTGTTSAPMTRIVPAPLVDGTGDASADSWARPAIGR